jgi:aminoglycoside 6'-N-acetyltransferase I
MHIRPLTPDDKAAMEAVADLLHRGLDPPEAGWPDWQAALDEVRESLAEDRLSLLAEDASGVVLGWIGAIRQYDGHVWELHPLVVHPAHRRRGIGRALVQALEREVAARGANTLMLGTDDVSCATSLGGVDLYPDVWTHVAAIRNLRGHPYTFYQRLGFVIVGVLPDANGPGKPDIYMAKRVTP